MKSAFVKDNVKQTIINMLTESTGTHGLDSGSLYGRHWESNQKVSDWDALPDVTWDTHLYGENPDSSDLCPVVSLYHYLTSICEFDELTDEINAILQDGREGGPVVQSMLGPDDGLHWPGETASFLYDHFPQFEQIGWGSEWNTCNGESLLSQVVQAISFTDESGEYGGGEYILLSIHNGCDVRGGYTECWAFKIDDWAEYFNPCPNVWGEIDGIPVSNGHWGYKITDEEGKDVPLKVDEDGQLLSEIDLYMQDSY